MAALSPVRSPAGIVALAERPNGRTEGVFGGTSPLVLIACDIQDPGNLGAVARVAEAAGASGLIAAGECADPFGWKALRGSMGSAVRLPIARETSVEAAIREARRRGCRVVAAIPRNGSSLFDADLTGPLAILVGGEGSGLSQALADSADLHLTIPMQSPVESLNTAVSAALLIYEARRQRTRKEKIEK
jgi:TrmH family RNA methyltransferase